MKKPLKASRELTARSILISLSLDGTPATMQQQRPTINNKDSSKQINRTNVAQALS